jgi:flagellar biosynthesis/type III secretory pathway protein FliH
MTSHKEGPQKFGRFIKKGDRLLKSIALEEFSFTEIADTHLTVLDNPEGSILHVRLHDADDLRDSVKDPGKFNEPLIDPSSLRGVIRPADFTADWRNSRTQMGRRANKDEDDDLDFGLQPEAPTKQTKTDSTSQPSTTPPVGEHASAVAPPSVTVSPSKAHVPTPAFDEEADQDVGGFRIERNAEAQPESLEQLRPTNTMFDPGSVAKAAATMAHQEQRLAGSEFIPINQSTPVADPEQQAVDEYRNRLAVQKSNEALLAELAEEAKAKGWQEGFKIGEEKAELQYRQNASIMFGKLADLISEFEKLKFNVLENVEQNFHDLCQAMAEALLRREFDIHPQAFTDVLRKAVAETVPQDTFKIRIHPETWERISKLEASDINPNLVKDSTIAPGDFRIESQLSVVDSGAKKLITALLEQVDVGLFKEKGKAS